jgi:hypothetical protein
VRAEATVAASAATQFQAQLLQRQVHLDRIEKTLADAKAQGVSFKDKSVILQLQVLPPPSAALLTLDST